MLFLFVALVIGRLAGIGADRAAEAEARAAEASALYRITRTLAGDAPDVALPAVARGLVADAGMDRVWIVIDDGGTERIVADTARRARRQLAGRGPGAHDRSRRARLGPHPRRPVGRRQARIDRRAPLQGAPRGRRPGRWAPSGAPATATAPSRPAPRPACSRWRPPRSASPSGASGFGSRRSSPRSPGATPRSRARSWTRCRTTCARRSRASAPPPARSRIRRYERSPEEVRADRDPDRGRDEAARPDGRRRCST